MTEHIIKTDGKTIEAFNDGIYINDIRVTSVEELEFVVNTLMKSVVELVQKKEG